MSSRIVTRIIHMDLNVGYMPYFETDEHGNLYVDRKLRSLKYTKDRWLIQFPLICCGERLKECLEFNLYLIDRRLGNFSLDKNKYSETEEYVWSQGHLGARKGKELSDESIEPMAKDLRIYLNWMIENNISYEYAVAIPEDYDPNTIDKAEALLPIWRFKQYIEECVNAQKWMFNRGNRILTNVRTFYLWLYRRASINHLPFSYSYKKISVKTPDNAEAIFSMPGVNNTRQNKRAIGSYISNLKLPNSAKQKEESPNEGLMPYSAPELKLMMSTNLYAHRTYGLFIKCGLLAGLRANEVVAINYAEIIDPSLKRVAFSLSLKRKFAKEVNLRIHPKLMEALWDYTQTEEWGERRIKHETKYGMKNPDHPLPLFINSSGERMKKESVSNTIPKIRVELKERALPRLDRDFHDLRATFATYWAIALLKKGYDVGDVKIKLMLLMSHETFETTQRYIDFAIEGRIGKHGAMNEWVVDIYNEVMKRVEEFDDSTA
ncbi:site-specific integrase [Vibrio parahaemolyticus]|nr:site-specific integrase [Vibrio parahaemolyticus]